MYARCTFTYTKPRDVVEGRIVRPIEAVMIVEMDKRIHVPMDIGVGRGPSGPSREGSFCRTVRLCRALEIEK